jgi:dipeptidyl aminopeptidase/acylaminoacyl peptidase
MKTSSVDDQQLPAALTEAQETQNIWLRRAGVALGAVGSLALLVGMASYSLSSLLIRPRLKRLSQLRSPHLKSLIRRVGVDFEEVVIASFDDTKLYGWWMKASAQAPTVVVLHGVSKNRTDVIRTVLVLRRAGLNVLVFDGRGHGQSEGRFVTYGYVERRDVEVALEWLVENQQIDNARIGLAGESMGAAIALQVAVNNPLVRAVWADSPFASLRRLAGEFVQRVTRLPRAVLDPVVWTTFQVAGYRGKFKADVTPLAQAGEISCPVFVVHGTADQLITTEHSQNIYDALPGKKELWLVEGARHARAARHFKHEYARRITQFFSENL